MELGTCRRRRADEDEKPTNVIQWGESREEHEWIVAALGTVADASREARDGYDVGATTARASFLAALRGAMTLLGVTAGPDVATELRELLERSAEHEHNTSERLVRAKQHREASIYSGRRGVLHMAAEEIERGLAGVTEIEEWEKRRAR